MDLNDSKPDASTTKSEDAKLDDMNGNPLQMVWHTTVEHFGLFHFDFSLLDTNITCFCTRKVPSDV